MPAPLPTHVHEAARTLRAEGRSIKRIAAELGVSPASVSVWVRDVPLATEQRAVLRASMGEHARRASAVRSAKRLAAREAAQEHGRVLARDGDPLHAIGCMLYWGEGTKLANSVCLTNSDAPMLATFRRFLEQCYGVDPERMTLRVNCFLGNGLELEAIETWWLEQVGLPASCLRPATVNTPSRASKATHRVLVHGTAALALHSTFVAQSILGAIQEYGGFDRPEWVTAHKRRGS